MPYQPLDLFTKGLMLGSTLLLIVVTVLHAGFAALPIVMVCCPVFLGLGVIIAGMGGTGWSRLTGLLYLGLVFLTISAFLGQDLAI